jgi:hypothetical protein
MEIKLPAKSTDKKSNLTQSFTETHSQRKSLASMRNRADHAPKQQQQ